MKKRSIGILFLGEVATGKGYYPVWPDIFSRKRNVEILLKWLTHRLPVLSDKVLIYLNGGE